MSEIHCLQCSRKITLEEGVKLKDGYLCHTCEKMYAKNVEVSGESFENLTFAEVIALEKNNPYSGRAKKIIIACVVLAVIVVGITSFAGMFSPAGNEDEMQFDQAVKAGQAVSFTDMAVTMGNPQRSVMIQAAENMEGNMDSAFVKVPVLVEAYDTVTLHLEDFGAASVTLKDAMPEKIKLKKGDFYNAYIYYAWDGSYEEDGKLCIGSGPVWSYINHEDKTVGWEFDYDTEEVTAANRDNIYKCLPYQTLSMEVRLTDLDVRADNETVASFIMDDDDDNDKNNLVVQAVLDDQQADKAGKIMPDQYITLQGQLGTLTKVENDVLATDTICLLNPVIK